MQLSAEGKVFKEKIEACTCYLSINLVFQQSFNISREILQCKGWSSVSSGDIVGRIADVIHMNLGSSLEQGNT
jgi:hypothetical protein